MGRGTPLKVAAFTVAMLLVLSALVITFGQFRFGSDATYRAEFTSASRLKVGQDVRIAGIAVGSVDDIEVVGDHVDVEFTVNRGQRLFTSTRAAIRYQNLTGDRYLEILSGPGDLQLLLEGGTIPRSHTAPALDLDALLGGLRPVLKGLDGAKINEVSNALIELLQGKGADLADVLSHTGAFTANLAQRDQLIGEVIGNLDRVLGTADRESTQLDASISRLQGLVSTLNGGRDDIAGAIPQLASAQGDLTELLTTSRRPLQGIIQNAGSLATVMDDRKGDINSTIEPLAEDYLRLSALGAYGSFFNIFFCSVRIKINGPAGSDILLPAGSPPAPGGRCDFAK